MIKKIAAGVLLLVILLCGCNNSTQSPQIAATTMPVYCFTARLCENTDLRVTPLITENVSCLHDYTLQVSQMRIIEETEHIVISGAGLEEFLEDTLHGKSVIDASAGIKLLEGCHHDHEEGHSHSHAEDPHIWLSPENAKLMAQNICRELSREYPRYAPTLEANLSALLAELDALQAYGESQLASLACREIITFHDGFSYLAHSFDLTILEALEEESGSEASAKELIGLIGLVREHELPAIFTEKNGSVSAAAILSSETGAAVYELDMAMAGEDYFEAMYRNIDTLKEALAP